MSKELKKSHIRLVGEIPSDWKVVPFWSIFSTYKGLSITKADLVETGIPVISYGQIHSKTGIFFNKEMLPFLPTSFLSYENAILKKGDVVFADTSEDVEGSGDFSVKDTDEIILAGYHNVIAKPKHREDYRFIGYVLESSGFRSQINSKVQGVKVYSITQSMINKTKIWLPPIEEQLKISSFLDEKVSAIENLVLKTTLSIGGLKKYKDSLISEIMTRGLTEENTKKSGVDWVEEIPESWNSFKIGQLYSQVKDLNKHLTETNLLSLSYGKIKRKNIESAFGLLPASFEGYNRVKVDDIVLRMTDLQNDKKSLRQGLVTERGIITSAYITIRPLQQVYSKFVFYQLYAFDLNKGYYGMGSGIRQGVNYKDIKNLSIFLPQVDEQMKIVQFLEEKLLNIDILISKKEELIEKLEQYKKSLIFEYVTGKKEVL